MLLRRYAQILGVVLILVGLLGLLLGERVWLGVLNVDLFEDIVHLVTGGLLAFVGFSERGGEYARSVVGGLGVVYLLVGLLGFATPALFGLLPHGYSVFDNLLHLALGIASIAVVFYSQAGRTAGRHGPRVARR
jgi:hypothetical protein